MSEIPELNLKLLHNHLFPKICEGKAVLLLGAGASVTDEKKFLSKEIIENYSRFQSLDYGTDDLVEFVDTLSADPSLTRRDFDSFVQEMLDKLNPTTTHELIVQIQWRQIITTNLDLAIERAYDRIRTTAKKNYEIKPIRSVGEEGYMQSPDEIRYVKLHGCISSRDRYPFVFATKDFQKSNEFYKRILHNLRGLSPEIEFISVGYSYNDLFAKHFLKKFDKMARAGRRRIYSVDPFVQPGRIPFFEEQNISIIRMTVKEFFAAYEQWLEEQDEDIIKRKRVKFFDVENKKLQIPSYLIKKLGDNLRSLSTSNTGTYIHPVDFYCGEEPSFDIIRQNLDVVKKDLVKNTLNTVEEVLHNEKIFVPIILLVGSFGLGKSTFLYRLVSEALDRADWKAVAFEVLDAKKLQPEALSELFSKTKASTIFLVIEKIEADSSYRAFRQLQARLTNEQFSDFKVILLSSIRENIFQKFRQSNALPDTFEIDVERNWTQKEVEELLKKLEQFGLVSFPDVQARKLKVKEIIEEYGGDLFVSLVSILKESDHRRILLDAFNQLSVEGQKTLIYTSLLNQHQIKMPLGLIRSLIGINWGDISERVLKVDFKGFVFQEEKNETGTDPDVYLQIRHRRIAELIVEFYYQSEDQLYTAYREIVSKLESNSYNATLLVDLLKAIRQKEQLNQVKIDELFDLAAQNFDLEPHFVIHYSMNLERRQTQRSLEKAVSEVRDIISFLGELQNDRLIHRRAVATAKLAQFLFKGEQEVSPLTQSHINDAEVWFQRKLVLDPQSHYSYADYLEFEIWCLQNLLEFPDFELHRRILIESLFEQAESLVKENIERIQNIKLEYYRYIARNKNKEDEYLKFLDEFVNSQSEKPLALVLKYYFYLNKQNTAKCLQLISEMQPLVAHNSVAAVLFRHYGQNLHSPDNRVKFWSFIKKHPEIEKSQPIRYHFFLSVLNAYDRQFQEARSHNRVLTDKFAYFNSKLQDTWKDSHTGEPILFEAIIILKNKRKFAHIPELQNYFPLRSASIGQEAKNGDICMVELKFFPYGINALLREVLKPHED